MTHYYFGCMFSVNMAYKVVCCMLVVLFNTAAACEWGSIVWQPCNWRCGGGTQHGESCMWGIDSSRACNQICYYGGIFSAGRCWCSTRRTGRCCESLRRCNDDNGGCAELCVTELRWSRCSCNSAGYILASDGINCIDVDECKYSNAECHTCINTPGSFHCVCNNGFTLDSNNKTCIDTDECLTGLAKCGHHCTNMHGTFICTCDRGYRLGSDKRTCTDINECAFSNGGCSQQCINEPGSFRCECNQGYRQALDGKTCRDIDECLESISKCSQKCQNTIGNYTCSCKLGYTLHTHGLSCEDIDECLGHFKGGCEDVCINSVGSYTCECLGNKTIQTDGYTCTDEHSTPSLFERNGIVGNILPRGCSRMLLTRCSEGKDIELMLSSTSAWYQLRSNASVAYTHGIVFVELNQLSLPVSVTGMQVVIMKLDFSINVGSVAHTADDGIQINTDARQNCLSFSTTSRDIHDILTSASFLKSFFNKLESFLPDWLRLSNEGTELLELHDLKTELTHGKDIDTDLLCSGAPVFPDHLYNVFKVGTNMSINLYGNKITLPKPLNDNKFCIIVDICQDYGGSIFLMLPQESRDVLERFDLFKNIRNKYNIRIRPRGLGLSLFKHVNVQHVATQLQLWNGDNLFNYPVLTGANMWLGGEVYMDYSVIEMQAQTDIFLSVPAPSQLLKSVFLDEWDVLFKFRSSADLKLKFRLFGRQQTINFGTIAMATLDAYASLGGNITRHWCGKTANPPGLFVSLTADVNPFQSVPIFQDWILDVSVKVHAFVTTDPGSKIEETHHIDIWNDILELSEFIKNFINITLLIIQRYIFLLTGESVVLINHLHSTAVKFLNQISSSIQDLEHFKLEQLVGFMSEIWTNGWKQIKSDTKTFIDSLEFNTRVAKFNFTELLEYELKKIQTNIQSTLDKLYNQVFSALHDYDGFGLRFTTSIELFGLKLFGVEAELVHAVDSLGACGKFSAVYTIFESRKATRLYIVLSRSERLGRFLRADIGSGAGIAFSTEAPAETAMQMHTQASLLGINVETDVFINENGLYYYIEGKIWNSFMVQINVSAMHGKDWNELTFRVQGKFVANGGEGDDSFQDSYLDGLRHKIRTLGDNSNKRITQAQQGMTAAQQGLLSAQMWLEEKKKVIRSANVHFDNAVNALETTKSKLEAAKGPFNRAIERLNQAQRNVDNLCRIRTCSNVCIPGIKCHWCHKRVWFVNIPYPCCQLTSCMISFPNPLCVVENLACRAIRAVAYVALQVAKVFVRVPMLAFDVAKSAVSVAQVVVDKSRLVLDVAVGFVDLAQVSLEGAKGVLDVAKLALEGVKAVVKVGFYVFEQVIKYGLQSVVDVKNCAFDIEMSTKDESIFDVSCQVNAFSLGWRTFRIRVNFNNVISSLWQAARATLGVLVDFLGRLFTGRKKREIMFDSMTKMHRFIRMSRESGVELDHIDDYFNETIDIVSKTTGFKNSSKGGDYENRVEIFKEKCSSFEMVFSFLNEANDVLLTIAKETKTMLGNISDLHDQINGFSMEEIHNNFTLEGTGINPDVAMRDYNLSTDDLNSVMTDAKNTLADDPLLSEIRSMSNIAQSHIKSQSDTVEKLKITDQWLLAMENFTNNYFEKDLCVSFLDCVHYSVSILYDLSADEISANSSEVLAGIFTIEGLFLDLTGNASHKIPMVHNLTNLINEQLNLLEKSVVFCTEAPTMLSPLLNQTITYGSSAQFVCNVTGTPTPTFWWYKDDTYIEGENGMVFIINNVTDDDVSRYRCVAGNIVANLTFDDVHVNVTEDESPILSTIVPTDENLDVQKFETSNEKGHLYASRCGIQYVGQTGQSLNVGFGEHKYNAEPVDLLVVLASTITSVVVVTVLFVIVWRAVLRHRFRKDHQLGSFASLNMMKPTAARKTFNARSNEVFTVQNVEMD